MSDPTTLDGALLSRFLDNACPDHHVRGGTDHVRAAHTAMRLLDRHPELPRANFYTAVVCGEVDAVNAALAADPGWATRVNGEPDSPRTGAGGEGDLVTRDWGPKGWEPLSYLCFTRLPLKGVADNAVAIARALLDHGASPNVFFMAGASSTRRSSERSARVKRAVRRILSATSSSDCSSIAGPSPMTGK